MNFDNLDSFSHFFKATLSNATARAGLIVSATTRDERRVTVIINGIENKNLPIIHVINSIAENIYTTVRVVDIKTFL
jgi:hypothetical protein